MIEFLYTKIGRGHAFYLDGIVELLKQDGRLKFESHDVFEISKDPALMVWKMARWLYKRGSTDSIFGSWYNTIRDKNEYNKNSLAMRIMGRDLRKLFLTDDTPLVVDHPLLVGMLRGKSNLIYQHGESVVPPQAVLPSADYVLVPVESSAVPFLNGGYRKEQIIICGLCIEPRLVDFAETHLEGRLKRITSDLPLTGAFFSSGAEPRSHIEKIVLAAMSVVKLGGKAIVFAKRNGKVQSALKNVVNAGQAEIIVNGFESREVLDKLTVNFFNRFDYLVAPSHERSNWALGLGLPIFILEPQIGPFAPLNKAVLLESGVAECINSIGEAKAFGARLANLRKSGNLTKMAKSGWEKHPITGFKTIADFLINKYVSSP